MNGTISKIHPKKRSIGHHRFDFIRVEFKMEDGSWAKTDLCPDFRNFRRWKPILDAGVGVEGMILRGQTVDADSPVNRVAMGGGDA